MPSSRPPYFQAHIDEWKQQVSDGIIDETTADALLSMGQLSSKRDSRLTARLTAPEGTNP